MRVIVCGSRDWTDDKRILKEITFMVQRERSKNPQEKFTIVHGAARGADTIAGAVAIRLGLEVEPHPALDTFVARRVRNKRMLALGADLVMAFKDGYNTVGGRDTEHMVSLAREAGIEAVVHGAAVARATA